MSEQESSARRAPWAILARIPDIVTDTDEKFPPYTDLCFVINDPPSVSVVKVPQRIVPDGRTFRNYPYIAAADPSGRLLLCANHRASWKLDWKIRDDDRVFVNDYYLSDTTTARSSPLPKYPDRRVLHPGNVGLIRRGGEYMVAELQHFTGTHNARLLCYSTETGAWVAQELAYSPDHPKWGNNGVISHYGRLWWVDLSYGLLTCDPFDDQPELRHVPLPQGCDLGADARSLLWTVFEVLNLYKSRCVKVSNGKLRYVQIDDGFAGTPKLIRMWTLDDLEGTEWTPGYVVSFAEIWADESYRAAGLQEIIPVLALIHPWNPNVVYFWQKQSSRMFALDVPAKKVLDCKHFMVADPSSEEYLSSHFLHAWEHSPILPRYNYFNPKTCEVPPVPVCCLSLLMGVINLCQPAAAEESASSASSSGAATTEEEEQEQEQERSYTA